MWVLSLSNAPEADKAVSFWVCQQRRWYKLRPLMEPGPVILEFRAPMARITLNRPERRNTLDLFSAGLLEQCVRAVSEREDLRILAITGQGESFCAGADPEYLAQIQAAGDIESFRQFLRIGRNLLLLLRRMPQLIITSANGVATGPGLGLILASDWAVAADKACFGETSVSDGLFPGWTGHWLLQERLGPSKATELVILGQLISAAEALALGLINQVVPGENLKESTDQMTARLCEAPPLVLRELKKSAYENHYRRCEEKSDFEIDGQIRCFLSEDSRAGVQATLRNRKAKFEGR